MMITWLVIYLLIIIAVGFALAAQVFGAVRVRLIGLIAMSLTLGCGAIGWLLMTESMCGAKPSRTVIVSAGSFAVLGALALQWQRRRLPRVAMPLIAPTSWLDGLTVLGVVLIVVQLYCAIRIALLPTFEIDAYSIWGLKAKVLYFEPLTPRPEYFSDRSLSFTHLDYPLLVPALWAGSYAMMHGVDDAAGKIVLILPVMALSALMYSSIRSFVDRPRAMLLTALATGTPLVGAYAGRGVADIVLALFAFAAVSSLVRWTKSSRIADAVLIGVFAALAAQTKLEGNPIVLSCAIVMTVLTAIAWLKKRERASLFGWLAFVLAALVTLGPWLVWSRGLPHTHENYLARLSLGAVIGNAGKLDEILRVMWQQARLWYYIAPLAMLLFAAIVGWRRWKTPDVLAAWFVLLAQFVSYVIIFMVTPWQVSMLAPFSLHRLFFHLAPIAMLIAAMHAPNRTEP